jgi:RNA polymerase sigma-70 factor (ECF subfamily)
MNAPDRVAFEELIRGSYESLYRFVTRKISNVASAEDVLQEALCDAFRSLHTFRGDAQLLGWVLGIISNKVRIHYRKEYEWYSRTICDDEFLATMPSEAQEPGDKIYGAQQMSRLAALLDSLPADMRSALWAVAVDGVAYEDVAKAQDIPIGTLRSRLFRARARIRAGLELDDPDG